MVLQQSKRLIQIFFLMSLFSCQGNHPSKTINPGADEIVNAIFVDCVFYSGSTQFFFQHESGNEFMISQSHEPDALKIINAETLLDPHPVEGPPGPNAEKLGKLFRIHYDNQKRVIKFSQLE